MPKIASPYWNERLGMCEKHFLPEVPCRQCLAEHDPDVEVRITEADWEALGDEPGLSVRDLLPAEDGDWLLERVVT